MLRFYFTGRGTHLSSCRKMIGTIRITRFFSFCFKSTTGHKLMGKKTVGDTAHAKTTRHLLNSDH